MADHAVEIWQCPVCGAQLDISEVGFYTPVSCPACNLTDYVHTVISGCRVEGVLGIGGMSVVLRARDLVLNRSVAIKLLNDTYRNQPERVARFENESAMMAKVRHENVVSVYFAGRARGQFYIAMEMVDGRDLETVVSESGPLSPLKAVEYTIQAVTGLQAAHNAGLLHRDMKPGNIIIDSEGCAKVLDFGLALGQQQEDTEEIIWATPYYVPPETLERGEEDARTDIYALGMTLRFLLTGVGDFGEPATSIRELLRRKQRLTPFAECMSGANESLCDLVDHMTAYEPANRPANYSDLLAELTAVRDVLLSDEEERSPERRRAFLRRTLKYAGITFAIGSVVAVLAAYFATPGPQQQLYTPPAHAVAQELSLAEEALLANDFERAHELFSLMATAEYDPALAAWSALHAALLADMLNMPASPDEFQHFVTMSRRAEGCAAARHIYSDFSRMATDVPAEQFSSAYLKSVYLTRKALLHFMYNETAKAEKLLADAAAARGALPAPYAQFCSAYDAYARDCAGGAIALRQAQARQELKSHRIGEARSRLNSLRSIPNLGDSLRTEVEVMLEVCDVAEPAFAMLSRRCGTNYTPGCSPDEVKALAVTLNHGELAGELATLCHLLCGDYQAAQAANPYRSQPQSQAPFAIMVRDWFSRLSLSQGE